MIDWTEKYRPKTLHQIVGNHSQIRKLQSWADKWKEDNPKKKAIVLSGKPGIGKTSAAYALSNDYHWLAIELNASDARNATTIKAVATAGATHQTFSDDGEFSSTKTGGRKLIIIDEADNLFERSKESKVKGKDFGDRDGKRTIVQTVKKTSQPIILIVNDDYQLFKGSGIALRNDCLHLRMFPAKSAEIMKLLKRICKNENIKVDSNVLFSICDLCKGDIRSAVRDLQSVCMNKTIVTSNDVNVLGHRDRSQLIFDVLKNVFHSKDGELIRRNVRLVQEDPQMMLLWIAENLPKSYSSLDDIASSYQWLSKSDMFLGRTMRRNNYRLWSYASDLSTIGVSFSKQDQVLSRRYQFPSWLKKTSKEKNLLSAHRTIIKKLSRYHHCSLKKTRLFILPMIKRMIEGNDDLLLSLHKKLDLTIDEVNFLSGKKAKQIILSEQKKKTNDSDIKKKDNKSKESKKEVKKQKKGSTKQQSLVNY